MIEGIGQCELCGFHVGTVRKQLHGHTHFQLLGKTVAAKGAAVDGVGCFVKDEAERIFGRGDALFQYRHGGLNLVIVGLGLLHGGRVGQTAHFPHLLHGRHVFAPDCERGLSGGQLLVEHLQRIIEVGHGRDDVGAHGLLGGTA